MEDAVHRKRLAQILRYIASMYQSLNATDGSYLFVRQVQIEQYDRVPPFFQFSENEGGEDQEDNQRSGILATTDNFRNMLAMESSTDPAGIPVFDSPPFSFYAASSSLSRVAARKRTFTGVIRSAVSGSPEGNTSTTEKSCWLRITRLTSAQVTAKPDSSHPAVRRYLEDWGAQVQPPVTSIRQLLTLVRLNAAPKVPPTVDAQSSHEIKSFLRRYKKYLRKRTYQVQLEPMYNRLFEWIQRQQDHHSELVWGLGHACILSGHTMINGPLLEILVEVELARDGALLVRPREHTGVALNREVTSALASFGDTPAAGGHSILAQLHRDVAELEPSLFSPGQPNTYIPLLKRIAVELSSGGSFQSSSAVSRGRAAASKLCVTEAWCLYGRPKPSSVWARDAMAFADQLILPNPQSLTLPQATWALTHGPGALDVIQASKEEDGEVVKRGLMDLMKSIWVRGKEKTPLVATPPRPLFPLPASDAQNRIADLLLNKQMPAVLCEGPPGTGKTHTIANIVCAYLCQGKRVLVTSKNAPALSVLRNRLPASVQELCVDVSVSELAGMRQLQQTVERLANRVSSVCTDVENEKCLLLQRSIDELEKELLAIDEKLGEHSEKIRRLVQLVDGQKLIELSLSLIEEVPWLVKSMSNWSTKSTTSLSERVESLLLEDKDPLERVTGFDMPPSKGLVSVVASKAGSSLSIISNMARETIAAVPGLGSASGMEQQSSDLRESLSKVKINGSLPETIVEWQTVLRALKHVQSLRAFKDEVWYAYEQKDGWPDLDLMRPQEELKRLSACLIKAIEVKELEWKTNVAEEMLMAVECQKLDSRRSTITLQVQRLAEELVDANVITELSRSFSADAQSALIRFSQIAGKAKFSRSSQSSKMTQRQKRRRQEYLDAFDRCCRFIPCWILTTSQISDYLPPESLFDLVVIDEASQSDVTVLPGMLRGTQWLIVGDGKQVSPTENFVSEESIEDLRAALPSSPLKESLLPGQSFFDLCAQAFPRGRVVLSEHFRCAPEIIEFSNREFYDSRLVPLRLPGKSERLSPSIVDVFVRNGVKVGKVNEKEADEIVRLVKDFVSDLSANTTPRSIGVISLVGDDQSRLIRGRLLDAVGPQLMARHDVLVGDPPTFQGAERDIIFISMVCSPGSVPTQNQQMHAQRANVAMSRARDRCILVRSIDLNDVPNNEDIKLPIIEFFQAAHIKTEESDEALPAASVGGWMEGDHSVRTLLERVLCGRGFAVHDMGVVWKKALCIEHQASDTRAALLVECSGESFQVWHSSYKQQKAIERVGWKCLRVDALSLVCNFHQTLESIVEFLRVNGIEEPVVLYDELERDDESMEVEGQADVAEESADEDSRAASPIEIEDPEAVDLNNAHAIVVISSDDEEVDAVKVATVFVKPEAVRSGPLGVEQKDELHESEFGEVVALNFLRSGSNEERSNDEAYEGDQADDVGGSRLARTRTKKRSSDEGYQSFEKSDTSEEKMTKRRRRPYQRLDGYSRDGRYYPGVNPAAAADIDADGLQKDWYDTDSDLQEKEDPKGGDRDNRDPAWTRSSGDEEEHPL